MTTTIEEQFASVTPLVNQLSHRHLARFGGEYEDIFQEASWLACKAIRSFKEERGAKLSTWVYHEVSLELMNMERRELRFKRCRTNTREAEKGIDEKSADRLVNWSLLTPQAQHIFTLFWNPPQELSEKQAANRGHVRSCIKRVREYAVDHGIVRAPSHFETTLEELRILIA